MGSFRVKAFLIDNVGEDGGVTVPRPVENARGRGKFAGFRRHVRIKHVGYQTIPHGIRHVCIDFFWIVERLTRFVMQRPTNPIIYVRRCRRFCGIRSGIAVETRVKWRGHGWVRKTYD